MLRVVEGQMNAQGVRFGVVVSRFNSFVTANLLQGCVDTIMQHGGSTECITIVHVPGAMEIPLACSKLAQSSDFDVVVALGAVIRGDTPHFDYVCNGVTSGVSRVALDSGKPVIFGVLTTETVEQALARCAIDGENKGRDAAQAAIEMVSVLRTLAQGQVGTGQENLRARTGVRNAA